MALTPMDIHNKEFSRGFKGYNEDQVDQFLDKIVEEFEKVYKENIDLKDKVSALSDQIKHYKSMENTLNDTLITAQKTAEQVIASAHKESELITKEAKDESKEIINNANSQVIQIQNEYQEIRKQIEIYKFKFKSLVETQLQLVIGDADTSVVDTVVFDDKNKQD